MAAWSSKQPASRRVVALVRLLLLGAIAGLLLLGMLTVGYYTDWLWFESLGFGSVYATVLLTQVAIFLVAAFSFFILLAVNVLLARRLEHQTGHSEEGLWAYIARMTEQMGNRADYLRTLNAGVLAAGFFFSIVLGVMAANNWLTVLRFLNARPFGVADPLFGNDA